MLVGALEKRRMPQATADYKPLSGGNPGVSGGLRVTQARPVRGGILYPPPQSGGIAGAQRGHLTYRLFNGPSWLFDPGGRAANDARRYPTAGRLGSPHAPGPPGSPSGHIAALSAEEVVRVWITDAGTTGPGG
jgi:hypothetical protein